MGWDKNNFMKEIYMLRKIVLEKLSTQTDIDFVKIDDNFKKEIENYFALAEEREEKILTLRRDQEMDPEASFKYFRAMERIEVRKKIIQILLAIALDKVPDKKSRFLFFQLLELSKDLIDFFEEEDVYRESVREFKNSDFLLNRIRDFDKFYALNKKEIKSFLLKAKEKENFIFLLEALFLTSLFWFIIREGNIRKIRKSDLYIYLLSKELKERYKK